MLYILNNSNFAHLKHALVKVLCYFQIGFGISLAVMAGVYFTKEDTTWSMFLLACFLITLAGYDIFDGFKTLLNW